jgi:hypothetical protein
VIYTHVAAMLLAAAAAAVGTWHLQEGRYARKAAIAAEQRAAESAEALKQQQDLERKRADAEAKYVATKKRAARDAAASQLQLDRLRDLLDTIPDEPPRSAAGPAGRADGDPRNAIIGECAAAAAALAQHADGLAAKLVGLQEHVRGLSCQ